MLELAKPVAALCQRTSAAILPFYGALEALRIVHKDNQTPLTEADLRAHDCLQQGLMRILDLPVVSEESPHYQPTADYWLIDPIDGTREFIEQSGQFCIAIARIQNHRPVFAMIYAPLSGHYWFAARGQGSHKFNGEGLQKLQGGSASVPRRLISAQKNLSQRYQSYARQLLGDDFQALRRGSALKFCALAEGEADVYPKFSAHSSEWDVAAGDLILHEAGGRFCWADGQLPRYGLRPEALNPPFLALGAAFDVDQQAQALRLLQQHLN